MRKHNPTLYNIIQILNDGQYHNGNQLAQTLQCSRTAIWKVIQKLQREYHVPIEVSKAQGYRLARPFSLLNPIWLAKHVPLLDGAPQIEVAESVNSTISQLKQRLQNQQNVTLICLAEHMEQGVGRFARHWHAPFADNLYFSMSHTFEHDISQLSGLSLVVGLTTLQTISSFGVDDLQVKWPNDVLYKGQKLSGNLLEISAEAHHLARVIISIGINVNMAHNTSCAINQPWCSMQQITGDLIDKNQLCLKLIEKLLTNIKKYQQHGLIYFTELWDQYDALKGKVIDLSVGEKKTKGLYVGISPQGLMIIKTQTGQLQSFSSGEASLHKENSIET